MEINKSNKLIAITGPSCAGKTTLGNFLKEKDNFQVIPQVTTRKRRIDDNPNEIICISHEEFKQLKDNNKFYIWSGDSEIICKENGNFYGILIDDVQKKCNASEKLLMYISYKDINQLIEKTEYDIKIINLKIHNLDLIMPARMYGNSERANIGIDEFIKRVDCAKKYENDYDYLTQKYANIIVTDDLTPIEVWQKVKRIIE